MEGERKEEEKRERDNIGREKGDMELGINGNRKEKEKLE